MGVVASVLVMVIVPVFAPTAVGVAVMVNVESAAPSIGLAELNALNTKPGLVVMEEIFR
jgi:hypothetical protein